MMSGNSGKVGGPHRVRIAAVGVAAVAALVFAGGAWAHPYTATIAKTPAGTAGTGDTDTYTYTIINKYASQKPKSAEITIPPSWDRDTYLGVCHRRWWVVCPHSQRRQDLGHRDRIGAQCESVAQDRLHR